MLLETQGDVEAYAQIFDALSQSVRITMIRMISEADELPCTVLDETLPIAKSTISYHVKTLHHAGLIEVRKDGRHYFYRIRREVIDRYVPGLIERLTLATANA
jgi:DNA-binding transcriptional ArsR family regulator